jgi:hypothetical protein
MKDKRLFLIPLLLLIPFFYIIFTGSKETIFLGFTSLALLSLFIYTLRLMSGIKTHTINVNQNTDSLAQDSLLAENSNLRNQPQLEINKDSTLNSVEMNTLDQMSSKNTSQWESSIEISKSFIEKNSNINNIIPISLGISSIRRSRFNKSTLGPMLKSFLKELPFRSKTSSTLICLYENSTFKEFLIQRGSLFIDCDTSASLEADEIVYESLLEKRTVLSENGRFIYSPIATVHKILGMICMESISGFLPSEERLVGLECEKFAMDWEARTDYELAILDPNTFVYNKNHYKTILREKFFSREEESSLFLLEISESKNRQEFISFLAENLSYCLYKIDESKLAFFLDNNEILKISNQLDKIVESLDQQGFYVEFYLAYSFRGNQFESAMDWEENAFRQLAISKKQSANNKQKVANG